jgi:hypothetical protein
MLNLVGGRQEGGVCGRVGEVQQETLQPVGTATGLATGCHVEPGWRAQGGGGGGEVQQETLQPLGTATGLATGCAVEPGCRAPGERCGGGGFGGSARDTAACGYMVFMPGVASCAR